MCVVCGSYLAVGVELAPVQPGVPVQLQHVVELLLGQAEVGVVRIRVRVRRVVAQQDALRPQDTNQEDEKVLRRLDKMGLSITRFEKKPWVQEVLLWLCLFWNTDW